MAQRELQTAVTLVLADQAPELAAAHDEVYPERVEEHIPISLTLLYPFVPAAEVDESHLETLRSFFASRAPLVFDLTHVTQWEKSGAVYAVPEPDDELRATMRELWKLFPEYPPYGEVGGDPPPHASLTLNDRGDRVATRRRVEERLEGLLPAHFEMHEVVLMEEYDIDRMRIRDTFALGRT